MRELSVKLHGPKVPVSDKASPVNAYCSCVLVVDDCRCALSLLWMTAEVLLRGATTRRAIAETGMTHLPSI